MDADRPWDSKPDMRQNKIQPSYTETLGIDLVQTTYGKAVQEKRSGAPVIFREAAGAASILG